MKQAGKVVKGLTQVSSGTEQVGGKQEGRQEVVTVQAIRGRMLYSLATKAK